MKTAIALGVLGGLALGLAQHSQRGPVSSGDAACGAAFGQDKPKPQVPPPSPPTPPNPPAPAALVIAPFFGNEKCPIDARPTLRDKSVDYDGQRIYGCSDACVEAI